METQAKNTMAWIVECSLPCPVSLQLVVIAVIINEKGVKSQARCHTEQKE